MKGILGKKLGMTQVFTKSGKLIPVTVIEVEPNVVTQVKTKENDGYDAIQLGFSSQREKLSNKASTGITNKANTTPKRCFKEIRGVNVADYSLGQEIKADLFTEGEVVDVTGTTKGHGFQGVIKRHGQSRGPMGHGSHYHRKPGSMGTMRPMRVFKGKKLPGHMGVLTVTIQNLEIVMVDLENNLLLVKGNVPGPKKGTVMIRTSIKTPGKVNTTEELINYETDVVENLEEIEANETTEEVVKETEVSETETEVETNEEVTEDAAEEQTEETSEAVSE